MTWGLGAAHVLANARDAWRGTALVVFQPGEETAQGASAMAGDWEAAGLPHADVVLGQHVMVGAAGTVSYRPRVILSAADSLKVKLFGRGSHGSQPQTSIDPVVMAAATVMRLQTIVSREVAPLDSAVLTIGSLQAGTKENIIPDDATIKLNMRTYDEGVGTHMLQAVKRICCAECDASGAPRPPEFTTLSSYPLTDNDHDATARVGGGLSAQQAGLLTLGYAIAIIAFIRVGEKLLQRFGPRRPMVWGRMITALAIALLMPTQVMLDTYRLLAIVGYTLFGLGLAFYATPSTDAALSSLPMAQSGSGAGIYKMASSLGAALGVAISGAIFTALGPSGSGAQWLEGVITFQGRSDNLAIREAAMVALGFNLLMVVAAIASILLTIPAGKRGK